MVRFRNNRTKWKDFSFLQGLEKKCKFHFEQYYGGLSVDSAFRPIKINDFRISFVVQL